MDSYFPVFTKMAFERFYFKLCRIPIHSFSATIKGNFKQEQIRWCRKKRPLY